MSQQQKIHAKAIDALRALEAAIDGLKNAGPCPLDGYNALHNIEERLRGILENRLGR